MPYTTQGLNGGVDGVAALGAWIAFHTADPGGVAGTAQHGTRAQTTWAAAAGGSRSGTEVTTAVAAGTALTHWSVNTASAGGTMLYYDQLRNGAGDPAPETFGNAGQIKHTPTIAVTN